MQGFELMLKAAGIDPQKLAEQAMERFLPELEKFKGTVVDTIKAEVIEPMAQSFAVHVATVLEANNSALMLKLESLDNAIHALNPGYTPLVVDLSKVTNPDTPEGGAVDMSKLDPEKLANQGSLDAQASLTGLGQVDVGTGQAGPAGDAGTGDAGAGSNGTASEGQGEAGAGSQPAPSGQGDGSEGQGEAGAAEAAGADLEAGAAEAKQEGA